MSITIQLIRKGWLTRTNGSATAYVRGQAHVGDEFLNTSALADRFLAQKTVDDLDRLVSSLNGTWAAVVKKDEEVYLAVDHIRSYQILYHVDEKGIDVFDDMMEYRKTYKVEPDERGVHEYLSSGYVYSNRTLFTGIYSLQAAERVVCRGGGQTGVVGKRYWRYIPNVNRPVAADEALVRRIDGCFLSAIKRLLESVGEKRIVVPLSGGYDSRIIVNYLHKVGFRKVLCYTYGVKDNAESRISKMVAGKLGYDWHFVEVTPDMLLNLIYSQEQLKNFLYTSNGCNRCYIQEFFALRDLVAQGVLDPARDVVVPGYYFDYLAGSHVTPWVTNLTAASEMCEWENNFFSHRHFLASIRAVRRVFDENGDLPAKLFYEGWAWQERLAKFIVNAVRTFELLGFDWRLPLCDRELFDLWLSLPYNLRRGRRYFYSIFKSLAVSAIAECPTTHDCGCLNLYRRLRRFVGMHIPYVLKYPIMAFVSPKERDLDAEKLICFLPSCRSRLQKPKNITLNAELCMAGLVYEMSGVS